MKDEKRNICLIALGETTTGDSESHMNVASNQRVSNKCGLNCLHTGFTACALCRYFKSPYL